MSRRRDRKPMPSVESRAWSTARLRRRSSARRRSKDEEVEGKDPRKGGDGKDGKNASQLLSEAKAAYSQGRNGDAYRLAGASHRQRASEDALIVRAKAACRLGNEAAAKKSFEELPMGDARREVRPVCRDKGIRLGL
jgi:hypothetical protein